MTFAACTKRTRLAVVAGLAAVFLAYAGTPAPVLAQDPTLVIGGRGGNPVEVDLSVLGGSGNQGRGKLLFPGSPYRPGQSIILRPPGTKPARLKKRRRKNAKRATHRHLKIKPRATTRMAAPTAPPKRPLLLAKPKVKSRPPAKKKRKRAAAAMKATPPKTAMAPIPAPPKAGRKSPPPTSLRGKTPPVSRPPPPPRPLVAAAPRTPVASAPLTKKSRPAAKRPGTGRQVAAIPRPGPIALGSSQRILFPPGSARLAEDGQALLRRISAVLKKNPALRLRLKAYARGGSQNVSQARRLSLSRALAIRANLMKQGIGPTRIDVQALGSTVADGPPNRVDLLVSAR